MRCNRVAKRIGLAVALLLIVFVVQLSALGQQGRIVEIKVHSKALEGNLLGDSEERNVTVYLPPEYNELPDKRFPVVYLLHGFTATDRFWFDGDYIKDLNVATIADELFKEGRIKGMILVAPDCNNTYGSSCYTNSVVTGNWEDFASKELIQYIDGKYRTIAQRTSRGIAGHSLGGYGAIKLAMKHPESYSAIYAMAPALTVFSEALEGMFGRRMAEAAAVTERARFGDIHWQSQGMIAIAAAVAPNQESQPFQADLPVDSAGNRLELVWQRWLEHDLFTMIGTHRGDLLKYEAIAIDCGTDDDLFQMNRTFAKALKDAGIEHTYEEFRGGHLNRLTERMRAKVFPFFSRALESDTCAKVETTQAQTATIEK